MIRLKETVYMNRILAPEIECQCGNKIPASKSGICSALCSICMSPIPDTAELKNNLDKRIAYHNDSGIWLC
jgi:hypothetical protein